MKTTLISLNTTLTKYAVHDTDSELSHGTFPIGNGDADLHLVFIRFFNGCPSLAPGDCLTPVAMVAATELTGLVRSGWRVQALADDGVWVRAIYTNRHVGDGFTRSELHRA